MAGNLWGIKDYGLGMGLRSPHYSYILEHKPEVDFFEIISETYLDTRGWPWEVLMRIREHYPVFMHGVSLSIGSTDPLNFDYLAKLKRLAHTLAVPFVSDHLCWTGVLGRNTHDLLPVPLTEKTLEHVVSRIKVVQDYLELPLALENPSNYVEFADSSMPEVEFMARMAEEADCGLLLDVNNVYVSAFNHEFDPDEYIAQVPVERIIYHHVAGHTHKGTHILDTHSDHVIEKVWEMYKEIHKRTGGRSTMVEWDEDIPAFEVVHAEVMKAQKYRNLARQELESAESAGVRR